MTRNDLNYDKGDNLNFFCIFTFRTEHYTLEIAVSQSWPNYIGPKRGKCQFCLTRQCLHPFPSRWHGLESPLLSPTQMKCTSNAGNSTYILFELPT